MKNYLLLFLFCSSFIGLSAQRPNIKTFRIPYKYCNLPTHYVEPDKRTFSVEGPNTDDITLYGYTYDENGGTVKIVNKSKRLTAGASGLQKKVTENKDKDGKVTSKTTTYWVASKTKGQWITQVYGPSNKLLSEREIARLEKKKAKAAGKKKKEEPKQENAFLANVEVEEGNDSADSGEGKERTVFYRGTKDYDYKTSSNKSSKTVTEEYRRDFEMKYEEFKESFEDHVAYVTESQANSAYGYSPKKSTMIFKVVGGKKHPEYKNYNDAMNAMKVILGKMKFNESIEQVMADAAPVENYLIGLTTRYKADEKKEKKVVASAYHNLALYYYSIDQLDKCEEMAQKMVDLKLDKSRGNRFLDDCASLRERLAHHKLETRHLLLEVDESKIVEEDESEDDETEEGGN